MTGSTGTSLLKVAIIYFQKNPIIAKVSVVQACDVHLMTFLCLLDGFSWHIGETIRIALVVLVNQENRA